MRLLSGHCVTIENASDSNSCPIESPFGHMYLRTFIVILLTILLPVTLCLQEINSENTFQVNYSSSFVSSTNLSLPQLCKTSDTIKIGYLTDMSGANTKRQGLIISGAITYAIDQLNAKSKNNPNFLKGKQFELFISDTRGDTLNGVQAMLNQWEKGVVAFFGPEDSCETEAKVASSLNLPMISYKCTDSRVSDKLLYPTFARTFPPDTQVIHSIISLLEYYQWKKFSLIYESTQPYESVALSLLKASRSKNLTINSERKFKNFYLCCEEKLSECCLNPFLSIINTTYEGTRIYLFIGRESDLIKFMLILKTRGILDSGEYAVLFVDLESYVESQSYKYLYGPLMGIADAKAAIEASRSLLVIVPSPPLSSNYTEFEDKVRQYNSMPPLLFPNTQDILSRKKYITIFASYLYDAVTLYAEALSSLLKENVDQCLNNGTGIIGQIIGKPYTSITGAGMKIDSNGDAEGNYTVLALQPTPEGLHFRGINNSFRPLQTMLPVGFFQYDRNESTTKFKLTGTINWLGKRPPLDEPPCGYDGSYCRVPEDNRREILAGVLAILFITSCLFAIVTYRNWKYEQEIAGLLWRISMKDLHLLKSDLVSNYEFSYSHDLASSIANSRLSLCSIALNELGNRGQISFTQTATYRGSLVAVKRLKFPHLKRLELPREVKKEMKLMKEIHHDNINPFIGAYIESNEVMIVTEYCAKGSLFDILEYHELNVLKKDPMFVASLVFDLIHGMIYLHDSDLKMHGNLKSHNCLITSRFVLQVSDFGLHTLRKDCEVEGGTLDSCQRMLWKAPELLRSPHQLATPKADVYAFALILHEILAKNGPFGINRKILFNYNDNDSSCSSATDTEERLKYTAREIIAKVKENRDHPYRPDFSSIDASDEVLKTLVDCWHEQPEFRPDFKTIKIRLKGMRRGLKPNIVDNMMDMMEKYVNNLEGLVEERTMLLDEEKKKTEHLLHQMLPKSVAADLIKGKMVTPESFEAVTIFFSDIVGFTAMCSESTPMEVVNFLHDLYQLFDDIISNYDVYKVETIGDAYMVVSGLPIRNGDLHAIEISSMALELLDNVKNFKIRHRPDDTLQLRIGIHTGGVVAGVVGKTMPRYCLFGDTVNTASRMESNGEALKIHISPQLREYLVKYDKFVIEERGFIKMKGKGEVKTYWLIGHKDPSKAHRRRDEWDQIYNQNRGGLSRRGSVVTFKGLNEGGQNTMQPSGSHTNLSSIYLMRLQGHNLSNASLTFRSGSPRIGKKLFKSKIHSREASVDGFHFNENRNRNLPPLATTALPSRPSQNSLVIDSSSTERPLLSQGKAGLNTVFSEDEEDQDGNSDGRKSRSSKEVTERITAQDESKDGAKAIICNRRTDGPNKRWNSFTQMAIKEASFSGGSTEDVQSRKANKQSGSFRRLFYSSFVNRSSSESNLSPLLDVHMQSVIQSKV